MIKIIIFLTLLMTFKITNSQIQIGLKHDLNGFPQNGYFDPLIYSPEKKITKVHNSDSYEVGYYYDSIGNRIEGLIKFENDKIFFKQKEDDFRIKIEPTEIKNFVIGVDSFFVVSNFYFRNRIKDNPEFVQFITAYDDHIFVKHYHFTSAIGQQAAMQKPIIETYLVKHIDSLLWDNFPDNNYFKGRALKYFNHIPYIKDKILSGEYTNEDMLSIIKMSEYNSKFNNSELIFYDKYWQEIMNVELAEYTAKIINKVDSIWTLEYYKDSEKLYEANYSSFYPNTKNGEFISFYPNGINRQITSFKNNKPTEVKTYSKNGLLNCHYHFIENKDDPTSKSNIKYIAVNDSFGNNILEKSKIEMFDDFDNCSYTSIFKNNERALLYRLIGSDTIFQITDPDYDFKIKALQYKFDNFMSEKKYDGALSENAQGIILVSILIDNKGYVLEGKILNNLHPELDKLVSNFVNRTLLAGAEFRYNFKPYKKGKVKKYCEVIIPFEFSINRFYRQPVSYNHFHHHQWQMNNQLMHQQMINNYRPPSFP